MNWSTDNVPADHPAVHLAPPVQRPAEPSERPPRADAGDPGHADPGAPLEGANAAGGLGAGDGVDGSEVDAPRAQRDLEPGALRVDPRGSGRNQGEGGQQGRAQE